MSIKTTITCNKKGCKKELVLDGPYFIAKKEAKEKGWKTRKVDGEWNNFCGECGE